MPDPELLDAWMADVAALTPAVDGSASRCAGRELLVRWSEPQRSYHTVQHLSEMLGAVDTLAAATGLDDHSTCIAHVAAWLHDAVYDVQAAPGTSERESAQLARQLLGSLGVGDGAIQGVVALILLTIDHGTGLPGPMADVFTDADLAILAAPAERFDQYCDQVRVEYAHVPDAAYAAGRTEILAALVDRAEVYRTAYARESWTAAARDNVARELARLGAGFGE